MSEHTPSKRLIGRAQVDGFTLRHLGYAEGIVCLLRFAEPLLLSACVLLLLVRGKDLRPPAGRLPPDATSAAHTGAGADDLLRRCFAILDSPFVSRIGSAMTLGRLGLLGLTLVASIGVWVVHLAGWVALACLLGSCLSGVAAAKLTRR